MKKIMISSLFFVFLSIRLEGQFTQVELFSGFDKTDFTFFSSQNLTKNQRISLSTLAFFQKFKNENQAFDEIGAQPTLFWNISKSFALGPSIYYNSFAGFSERLSAKYTLKTARIFVVVMPTIAHSEQTDASYTEAFIQVQYNKPLNNRLSLWLNGQFLTIWDEFKTHSRSYQQFRFGLSLDDHQLGLAIDFDQYGTKPIEKTAIGFYYRKTL